MSAKESSNKKNGKPDPLRIKRPAAEQAQPKSELTDLDQQSALNLPNVPTAQRLRQSYVLQMQRRYGNSYVQRLLDGRDGRPVAKVQRQDAATASQTESAQETGPTALIVQDSVAELAPGQMRKKDFLAQLEKAVCAVSDEALKNTFYSAVGCPYIDRVFKRLPGRSSEEIERMIHLFAPGTKGADTAQAYIRPVTERVRTGIARWLVSGQVTGLPPVLSQLGEAAGEKSGKEVRPTLEGGEMVNRQLDRAGQGEAEASHLQREMGEGRSIDGTTRANMEKGFGRSFGDVVIHTNAQAAQLARQQNARAFTIGQHVAFSSGEYRPGTPVGDALLAHELAHTIQQKETLPQIQRSGQQEGSLESDADRATAGLLARLWGGTRSQWANIRQNAVPAFRSGLRLQRCSKRSHQEMEKAKKQLDSLLANPDKNADEIIQLIDSLGGDAADILMMLDRLAEKQRIVDIAGTERGDEILDHIVEALRAGGQSTRPRGDELATMLAELRAEREGVSENTKEAINRINKAIEEDPRRSEYESVLQLPVTLVPNVPKTGGLYYDSGMPKPTDEKTHTGETELVTKTDSEGEVHYTVIYIKLGPRVLMYSDNYIRSTLWHEFQHYKRYSEFREEDSSQSEESLEFEGEIKAGNSAINELEATSIQLAADFDKLNEPELASLLPYLAEHMSAIGVPAKYKDQAVNRIMSALGTDETKLQRLLDLTTGLSTDDKKALAPLIKALEAKLPAKKKNKKKNKKKGRGKKSKRK